MRKKQVGQAFIFVLILLAIGALLVVPALRLSFTELKTGQIVRQKTRSLYAVSAAQEWVMWSLADPTFATDFEQGIPNYYELDVCGTSVNITIVMRAIEGSGGLSLVTNDVIKPTKTCFVEEHPEWSDPANPQQVNVPNGYPGPYTYIIELEQLSSDNSKGLDSVYDVLPKGLNYDVSYGSWLRVDGGEWVSFPGPHIDIIGGQDRLRWPAVGFFDEEMHHFDIREVKEIKFQVTGSLADDTINYNWVLLNVEDIDTLSGPVAPIKLGAGTKLRGEIITVTKTANPQIIPPGMPWPVEYTISITNLEIQEDQIYSITDYLPPGFSYSTNIDPPELLYAVYHPDCQLPSGITTSNPNELTILTKEGAEDRYRLYWEFSPAVSIASGETLTLTFWALANREVSDTYYNEVVVVDKLPLGTIYMPPDMDVTSEDFNSNYSWNTGGVMVPAFDSEAKADGTIIDANLSLMGGGVVIFSSWQVR